VQQPNSQMRKYIYLVCSHTKLHQESFHPGNELVSYWKCSMWLIHILSIFLEEVVYQTILLKHGQKVFNVYAQLSYSMQMYMVQLLGGRYPVHADTV